MTDALYVYILASQRNRILYTGSTPDLVRRVWEHKNKVIPSFTSKYNVKRLVYYEVHSSDVEAARREKRLNHWPRKWKLSVIETMNPTWLDWYETICS